MELSDIENPSNGPQPLKSLTELPKRLSGKGMLPPKNFLKNFLPHGCSGPELILLLIDVGNPTPCILLVVLVSCSVLSHLALSNERMTQRKEKERKKLK